MKIVKKNYKFILGILIGIIVSGTTAYAITTTVIDSKYVAYTDNSSLGFTNVQAAIDGTCSNISTVLSSLKPVEYIKPTPVDGVSITRGGYTMLGNICVVNMVVSIDTSKLSISTNSNTASQTIIATGMPIPKEDTGYLNSSYNSPTFKSGISYTTSVYDDTLRFYQNSQYTYTSSYGIVISGMYLVA